MRGEAFAKISKLQYLRFNNQIFNSNISTAKLHANRAVFIIDKKKTQISESANSMR